jgi:hypothetical protein
MSTTKFKSFKLRGSSAVPAFVATVKAHRFGHAIIGRSTRSARLPAANTGEVTSTLGPRNRHLGSYFSHTLEPAA